MGLSSRFSKQNRFENTLLFLFFLSVVIASLHTLWADDLFWHLKTGEWILTHRAIPTMDLYSYTASDHPWIDLSWGFQVLLYLFYHVLGIPGIILFKVSLVILMFWVFLKIFHHKLPLLLFLPILYTMLLTLHERLLERPEVLSYLFLTLTLYLLEKEKLSLKKQCCSIALLQIVWVNTHALFILGLSLGGLRLGRNLVVVQFSF